MAILPKRGRGGEASTLETNKQNKNKTHRRFITFPQKHVWCDTVTYFRNNRSSGGVWMLRDALRASCFFCFFVLFFLRGGITRSNNIKRFKVQTKVEIYKEVFSLFPLFLYIYRVRVRVRVHILFFFSPAASYLF